MKHNIIKTNQIIQWTVFILAVAICLFSNFFDYLDPTFYLFRNNEMVYIFSLITVGSFQILGALVNLIYSPKPKKFYKLYLKGIVILFSFFGFTIVFKDLNTMTFMLLIIAGITSPFIAFLYLIIPLIKKF